MLLVLVPADRDVSLSADVAARLAALGVSSLSFLRNEDTLGVVLDGWAFDPARSGGDAVAILGGAGATLLHPVMHLAVRP
jgi:hypothetical protein